MLTPRQLKTLQGLVSIYEELSGRVDRRKICYATAESIATKYSLKCQIKELEKKMTDLEYKITELGNNLPEKYGSLILSNDGKTLTMYFPQFPYSERFSRFNSGLTIVILINVKMFRIMLGGKYLMCNRTYDQRANHQHLIDYFGGFYPGNELFHQEKDNFLSLVNDLLGDIFPNLDDMVLDQSFDGLYSQFSKFHLEKLELERKIKKNDTSLKYELMRLSNCPRDDKMYDIVKLNLKELIIHLSKNTSDQGSVHPFIKYIRHARTVIEQNLWDKFPGGKNAHVDINNLSIEQIDEFLSNV